MTNPKDIETTDAAERVAAWLGDVNEQAYSITNPTVKDDLRALLAENASLASAHAIAISEWQSVLAENARLTSSLQSMQAVFHTNMLRAYPDKSHAEISEEIDKALAISGIVKAQSVVAPEPAAVPGWKLVPIQPTDEMRDRGNEVMLDRGKLFHVWSLMLAAAPVPPVAAVMDELSRFESWARTSDGNCSEQDLRKLSAGNHNRVVDGCEFVSQAVERDWNVWQARAAQSAVPPSVQVPDIVPWLEHAKQKYGSNPTTDQCMNSMMVEIGEHRDFIAKLKGKKK